MFIIINIAGELLRIPGISAARIPNDYDASISDHERARRLLANQAKTSAAAGGAGDDDDFVRSLAPQEIEQVRRRTDVKDLVEGWWTE